MGSQSSLSSHFRRQTGTSRQFRSVQIDFGESRRQVMKHLNAGVIGLGVGMNHVRTLLQCEVSDVVAVCDHDESRMSEVQKLSHDVTCTKDASEILDDPSIDLVVLASYDNDHHDQVIKALKNGKHVFVEKPMCLYEDELKSMARQLEASEGLSLSSNLALRSCPRFSHLREAILNEEMGRVYWFEGDYFWGRPQKLIGGWRADMPFYSIIHGAAVHMVDLILWCTGKLPESVTAIGSNFVTQGTRQQHNDFAALLLRFPSGMAAKVTAHGGCVHPHFHRVSVTGTARSFFHELNEAYWIESCEDTSFVKETGDYPAREQRSEILASYVRNLCGEKGQSENHLVTEADCFATMSVCLAAERAMKSGKEEAVNYIAPSNRS